MKHFIRYAEEFGCWLLHRDLGDGRVNVISQLTDEDINRICRDYKLLQYKRERYVEELDNIIREEQAHKAYILSVFNNETELCKKMVAKTVERIEHYRLMRGDYDEPIEVEGCQIAVGAGSSDVDTESLK